MSLKQNKPVPNQQQAILAEKRAEALRANLKKRKEQSAARSATTKENSKEET